MKSKRKNTISDIKMDFKLLEAQYPSLNRDEQIVLIACLSQINPTTLDASTPVSLVASEFKDLTTTSGGNRYRDLKSAVDKLYSRSITIENPDPDNPKLSFTRTRWVHSIDYYEGEGRLVLYFAPKLIPYIADLQGNYRSFEKLQVSNFKSKHTLKLYQLLIQWQGRGQRELTLDEIRKIFDLGDVYQKVAELKRRVIDPAIADINEHTNLWVGTTSERRKKQFYSQRKQGRRVIAFQFTFGFKDKKSPRKQNKSLTVQQYVSQNPDLTKGKSESEVQKMLKEHEEKYVDENQQELF